MHSDIEKWLDEYTRTICEGLLEDHMSLISKEVRFHGLPGKGEMRYQDLADYYRSEFSEPEKLPVVDFTNVEIEESPQGTWNLKSLQTYYPPSLPFIQSDTFFVLKEEEGKWKLRESRLRLL